MRRLVFPVAGLAGLALAVVPALASHEEITTSGSSFSPNKTAVKPGENHEVTIRNGGMGNHNLLWEDGAQGESGATQSTANFTNWSVTRTFDSEAEGEYVFYCSVHGDPDSGMRGIVYVNAAGTVPGGGTPPGTTTTTTSTTPPPGTTTQTQPPPPPPGGTTSTTPPPGSDTTAPRMSAVRARANRRGVRVVLTLSEAADVTVRLVRRGRRVARRTFSVDDGVAVLRIRRALRRGRYRLRLAAVDEAGNRRTRRLSTRVR
jgi:plastocyanin